MNKPIRVLHLISGLGQGGAESVLTRLVTNSTEKNIVLSFTDEGVYGAMIRVAGVELHCLGMNPGRITLGDFRRLVKKIRELQVDVVQTWMYHADLIGGLAARLAACKHIAWGIRNSGYQLKQSSRSAYYIARVSGFLSRLIPQKIIACGEQAARLHGRWGYDLKRMVVIQNGYDLTRWQADRQAAQRLREQWQVGVNDPVFGFVARWNPLKDHQSLLQAFVHIKQNHPRARCVLVGKGLDKNNVELMALLKGLGLQAFDDIQENQRSLASERNPNATHAEVILLGMRQEVSAIMTALDVHVLSSIAEGFPNVVAEAMACETPCVVTDVGDAALMVGDLGWVAEPSNPADLANKMEQALSYLQSLSAEEKVQYQKRVRHYVVDHFSLNCMIDNYEQTWRSMMAEG